MFGVGLSKSGRRAEAWQVTKRECAGTASGGPRTPVCWGSPRHPFVFGGRGAPFPCMQGGHLSPEGVRACLGAAGSERPSCSVVSDHFSRRSAVRQGPGLRSVSHTPPPAVLMAAPKTQGCVLSWCGEDPWMLPPPTASKEQLDTRSVSNSARNCFLSHQ